MGMKEAYEKKLEAKLNKWNADIDKLKAKADSAEADAQLEYYRQIEDLRSQQEAARQETRANLKTLRQQRIELAEWYGSFKNSSINAWEQMKKGFTDAYQAMSDSWEKALEEYNTDKK